MVENEIVTQRADAYCSTTEAAKLLGVSVGTVQQMVEAGKLSAWKTSGGHRRILLQSLQQHRQPLPLIQPPAKTGLVSQLQVMIVEDDDFMRGCYERELAKMQLPLQLELYDNGLEAMLRLGAGFPHLLILDLEIPFIDGFEMLKRIKAHRAQDMRHIIVVSGLEQQQLDLQQEILQDVTFLKKPLDTAVLKGYLLALKQIYL